MIHWIARLSLRLLCAGLVAWLGLACVNLIPRRPPLPPSLPLRFTLGEEDRAFCSRMALSPDGTMLASTSDDKIKLWDVATRHNTATLAGHQGAVHSIAFSPDGATLAAGVGEMGEGADREGTAIVLWHIAEGQQKAAFKGSPVDCVAFRPDGKVLASASDDEKTIKIRDVTNGKNKMTLIPCRAFSVAFSPDGKKLAAATPFGSVKVWDLASGKAAPDFTSSIGEHASCVAFSPDGKSLAAGGASGLMSFSCLVGNIGLWDLASGSETATFPVVSEGADRNIQSVAFSPDGRLLATGCGNGQVCLYDTSTGKQKYRVLWDFHDITSVAFSRDGKFLAAGGFNGQIWVWDMPKRH